MILIADSGSTKTDWVLWDKDTNQSTNHQSKGLNPFFVDAEEIAETLMATFSPAELKQINEIHFYGSGCGTDESQKTIMSGLRITCPLAKIEVAHDLLAAARALNGNKPGIACILGTGSNACVYDGEKIIEEGVSFGYVMGDEGSGNHFGRLLLKAIYTKKAPVNIIESFEKSYPYLSLTKILDHLYHRSSPNKFLATFSPFIRAHHKDPFIQNLISESFNQFCATFVHDFVEKYKYPVSFQGSIAWNYKEELTNCLKKNDVNLGGIIQKPMQYLFQYHKDITE